MNPPPSPPQQAGAAGLGGGQQPPRDVAYFGINFVLCKLGHTMYDFATIKAELSVQLRGTPGDLANWTAFRDFVVNVQQFRVYLAMLGGQTHVSMIHTLGVYYSIASATSLSGTRWSQKNPPQYALTSKSWEWHTGNVVADSKSSMSSTLLRPTRVPCGRRQLATGPPPSSRSQIWSPSQMCLSISYIRRAWWSRHTMYWLL